MKEMTLLQFMLKYSDGHRIVNSSYLTDLQIALFRAEDRWYVDPETMIGWAAVPWHLTTMEDRKRESNFFGQKNLNEEIMNLAGYAAELKQRLADKEADNVRLVQEKMDILEKGGYMFSVSSEETPKIEESSCKEDDGCPKERAVLQRFWRQHTVFYQLVLDEAVKRLREKLLIRNDWDSTYWNIAVESCISELQRMKSQDMPNPAILPPLVLEGHHKNPATEWPFRCSEMAVPKCRRLTRQQSLMISSIRLDLE